MYLSFKNSVRVALVFIASITLIFTGCSNSMDTQANSESETKPVYTNISVEKQTGLLGKYPMLDLNDPISVWWEGTPGCSCLDLNVPASEEIFKQEYYIRNNTTEDVTVSITNGDIEREVTIASYNTLTSYIELIPSNYTLNKLFDPLDKYNFGMKGPKIEIESGQSFDMSLDSIIYAGDPEIEIDWGELPDYETFDYSDTLPQKITVVNNGDKEKAIEIFTSNKQNGKMDSNLYDNDEPRMLEAGESISLDYNVFIPYNAHEKCGIATYNVAVSVDNYQYLKTVYIQLYDCNDWLWRWADNPKDGDLRVEIGAFEKKYLKVEVTNACDRKRLFKPDFFDAKFMDKYLRDESYGIYAQKDEYHFDPNSTQEVILVVVERGGYVNQKRYRENVYEIDLLERHKKKDERHPLKLTIIPKFVSKENNRYRIELPEDDNSSYGFVELPGQPEDRLLLTKNITISVDPHLDGWGKPLSIICIDKKTGKTLWEYFNEQIAIIWYRYVGNNLILNTAKIEDFHTSIGYDYNFDKNSDLYCIDLVTGDQKWHIDPGCFWFDSILLTSDSFYFSGDIGKISDEEKTKDNYVSQIDIDTGEINNVKVIDFFDVLGDGYNYSLTAPEGNQGKPNHSCHEDATPVSLEKIDIKTGETVWKSEKSYCGASIVLGITDKNVLPEYRGLSFSTYGPFYDSDSTFSIQKINSGVLVYAYGLTGEDTSYCCEAGVLPSMFYHAYVGVDRKSGEILWETELPRDIEISTLRSGRLVHLVKDNRYIIMDNYYEQNDYTTPYSLYISIEDGAIIKEKRVDKVVHSDNKYNEVLSCETATIMDDNDNMIEWALRINKRNIEGNYVDDPICILAFSKTELERARGRIKDTYNSIEYKCYYIDDDSILLMLGNMVTRYDAIK